MRGISHPESGIQYLLLHPDRIKNTLSTSVNGTMLAGATSTLKDRIRID